MQLLYEVRAHARGTQGIRAYQNDECRIHNQQILIHRSFCEMGNRDDAYESSVPSAGLRQMPGLMSLENCSRLPSFVTALTYRTSSAQFPYRAQGRVNERQTQEACYIIRPMITNTRGVALWRLCASSS